MLARLAEYWELVEEVAHDCCPLAVSCGEAVMPVKRLYMLLIVELVTVPPMPCR
jgi:hypothetical protein